MAQTSVSDTGKECVQTPGLTSAIVNTSLPKGQSLTLVNQTRFLGNLSDSDDDDASEVDSFILEQSELGDDVSFEGSKFLLSGDGTDSPELRGVDAETQARLEALLEAAGIGKLATCDGKHYADPEVLRKLTSSVSCALDEAAAALSKMRAENVAHLGAEEGGRSLVEACSEGDVVAVRRMLIDEGRNVNETTEDGESLLSLACSAGYYELAQVLIAMKANVEDRGNKGECTPIMEAASSGHVDIVKLLIASGADVNSQSSSGNTPLMYACAGGHEEVVRVLLQARANIEDHNENGHTPLMEAASAGHVEVARILLEHGAGINTHSNEFKESALTLACYKGHLEMVRFLLEAGADQEHKTDEMHTALMEASMDGHVEVARLLLDSGAQVNMPADSFESPLTLAACGGHIDLAMLLLERGANIEEVNDEGYTPLMEAAREGHEEMVALLLSQGADINAQTEETQETGLTLSACGGFLEVTDFLVKAGADMELGASTALMEAAQEGHVEIVRYLVTAGANPHTVSQTQDTALSYAAENGHTDVVEILLQAGSDLEHESEGGRTPVMKAARAGHMCTVQFLISKGANIWRPTVTNDHTSLSLACAGGHTLVVELLLANGVDPTLKLKDNSTMLIEAAKGGHTAVVQLLLDYPHNIVNTDLHHMSSNEPPRVPPHGLPAITAEEQVALAANFQYPVANVARSSDALTSLGHSSVSSAFSKPSIKAARSTRANVPRTSLEGSGPPPPPPPPPVIATKLLPPVIPSFAASSNSLPTHADMEAIKNLQFSSPSDMTYILPVDSTSAGSLNFPSFQEGPSYPVQSKNNLLPHFDPNFARQLGIDYTDGSDSPSQTSLLLSHLQAARLQTQTSGAGSILSNLSNPNLLGAPPASFTGLVAKTVAPVSTGQSLLKPADYGQVAQTVMKTTTTQTTLSGSEVVGSIPPSERPKAKAVSKKDAKMAKLLKEAKQRQQQLLLEEMEKLGIEPYQLDPEMDAAGNSKLMQELAAIQQAQTQANSVSPVTPGLVQIQENTSSVVQIQQNATSTPGLVQIQGLQGVGIDPSTLMLSSHVYSLPTTNQLQMHGHSPQVQLTTAKQQLVQTSLAAQTAFLSTQLPAVPTSPNVILQPATSSTQQLQGVKSTQSVTSSFQPVGLPATNQLQVMNVAAQAQTLLTTTSGTLTYPSTMTNTSYQAMMSNLTLPQQAMYYPRSKKKGSFSGDISIQLDNTGSPPVLPDVATIQPPFLPSPSLDQALVPCSASSLPYSHPAAGNVPLYTGVDVDSFTESNHDTALTLACAGGHEELVKLLLEHNATIEHRDKKGFTPLILASTAGHTNVVKILLEKGADIEAQSERTKDTALSLACSGGRYEVVALLLNKGANKEHRNVSDYTPLSLAASGGYVSIIQLLLDGGAEINSRTNSKLGISPLMLAAMNGHVAAVKLLLDQGSDVNAQIETNRNTALTLACFQGRHEVVSLLVDKKANVEHRAKTGLTPLMEAASGGYTEVGRVLLDKGADVNAPPVPTSRDTALTIACDKGHVRFVELLLNRNAQVEAKNKKGDSPLWLSCNGGHLEVIQLLVNAGADVDSQDNRKVSCLMSGFRRGHMKVVKWMVRHVGQFPSDKEMTRFIATLTDKELLKKCHQCMEVIRAAKDRQAAEANKNATSLLQELDMERTREESRRAAAARRREKKRLKKKEKAEQRKLEEENRRNEELNGEEDGDDEEDEEEPSEDEEAEEDPPEETVPVEVNVISKTTKQNNSQTGNKAKQNNNNNSSQSSSNKTKPPPKTTEPAREKPKKDKSSNKENRETKSGSKEPEKVVEDKKQQRRGSTPSSSTTGSSSSGANTPSSGGASGNGSCCKSEDLAASCGMGKRKKEALTNGTDNVIGGDGLKVKIAKGVRKIDTATGDLGVIDGFQFNFRASNHILSPCLKSSYSPTLEFGAVGNPKQNAKRGEDGWKEVVRRREAAGGHVENEKQQKQSERITTTRSKKVSVPASAISRVIGRAGCNINAVREASGAHIEIEKQQKGQGERSILIRGTAESTKHANQLITALVNDPDKDLSTLIDKCGQGKSITIQGKSSPAQGKTTAAISAFTIQGFVSQPTQSKLETVKQSALTTSASSFLSSTIVPAIRHLSSIRPTLSHAPAAFSVPSASNAQNWSLNPSSSNISKGPPSSSNSGKSGAARQLFANEKKQLPFSHTNSKTTVSYTNAVMSGGKSTKTTSAVGMSFASKVTESQLGPFPVISAFIPPPKTSIRNSQPPTVSKNLTSTTVTILSHTPTSSVLSGTASTSSCITSTTIITTTMGQSRSHPGTPVNVPSASAYQQNSLNSLIDPAEFSPFNNMFSKVAQSRVWGREKDNENRGMNFASVAAANIKPIGPAANNNNNNPSPSITVPLHVQADTDNMVDIAKAPGYRGVAHVSPNTCSLLHGALSPYSAPMQQNGPVNTPPPSQVSINSVSSPSPTVYGGHSASTVETSQNSDTTRILGQSIMTNQMSETSRMMGQSMLSSPNSENSRIIGQQVASNHNADTSRILSQPIHSSQNSESSSLVLSQLTSSAPAAVNPPTISIPPFNHNRHQSLTPSAGHSPLANSAPPSYVGSSQPPPQHVTANFPRQLSAPNSNYHSSLANLNSSNNSTSQVNTMPHPGTIQSNLNPNATEFNFEKPVSAMPRLTPKRADYKDFKSAVNYGNYSAMQMQQVNRFGSVGPTAAQMAAEFPRHVTNLSQNIGVNEAIRVLSSNYNRPPFLLTTGNNSNYLLYSQRQGRSKDEGSPVNSPHSESPINLEDSRLPRQIGAEQMKMTSDDGRLPRPIGMERAYHRKTPLFGQVDVQKGLWNMNSSESNCREWSGGSGDAGPANVDESHLALHQPMADNMIGRFTDPEMNGPVDAVSYQAQQMYNAAAFMNNNSAGLTQQLLMNQMFGSGGDTHLASAATNHHLAQGGSLLVARDGWNKMDVLGQHGAIGQPVNSDNKTIYQWTQQQQR